MNTYLILGATGGIGSELTRRLANDGANLVLAARNEARLEKLAAETGGTSVALDARNTGEVEAAAKQAVEKFGRLDGIANCVGSILLKPAHITKDEDWRETLETNLGTAFAAVKAAGLTMRNGGSVVLMSSAAARIGLPNHEAIAAAKAGVTGLMRSAAATYAPKKIRFNAVAPGLVQTPGSAKITASEISRNASLALHALGELGKPADIAPTIAWLLSEDSAWVTGQEFGIDGGLATVRAR